MDAAGKDGAIRHVMSGVNPQGCQVFSFKHPSADELEHDFSGAARDLPERGRIGIFNRSYYEEVLVVRVHADLLAARRCRRRRCKTARSGMIAIVDRGSRSGTCTSTAPGSSSSTCTSRRRSSASASWRGSTSRTRTGNSAWPTSRRGGTGSSTGRPTRSAWAQQARKTPWYVVPADDKKNARLIVSQIVLDTFEDLKMCYPKVGAERKRELLSMQAALDVTSWVQWLTHGDKPPGRREARMKTTIEH